MSGDDDVVCERAERCLLLCQHWMTLQRGQTCYSWVHTAGVALTLAFFLCFVPENAELVHTK